MNRTEQDKREVKTILRALEVGKTIVFYDWNNHKDDEYTKTEKGFINAAGNKITIEEIANKGYRACDNLLKMYI